MKRLILLAAVLVLAGCTAAPAPAPVVTTAPIAAELTCEQFSTLVETPIHNAMTGPTVTDLPQEYVEGMYRIAARALPLIQVEPGTELDAAITGAQALVTSEDTLEFPQFDPTSAEWQTAREAVLDACAAEGIDMYAEGWIGG
jgi:hypothetical protein